MVNKVLINLKRGTDLRDFKNNDILMFDAVEKNFYRVTPETFFDEYEKKLNQLMKRYDEQVSDVKKDNDNLREEFKQLRKDYNAFAKQIKDSNTALIDMLKKIMEEKEGNE